MAKKSVVARNEKRKKIVARYADVRNELRKKAKDINLSPEERFEAQLKLQSLPRDSSPSRLRNRCQVTGRPRGVYRRFMVSRIVFREYAHRGYIPGVTKSSW